MLNSLFAIVLVSLGCAATDVAPTPASTPAPATAPAPRAVQIKRPNLLVADLERSLTLYRDALGLPLSLPVAESLPTSYSYPVFNIPANAKIRYVYLDVGEEARGLGLTEVRGVPLPKETGIHSSGIVVKVTSVDGILDRVRKLGLSVVPPRFNPPANGHALYEAAFIDFDGHLVVIYEFR